MILAELESDIKLTFNDPTQYGNTKGSSTTHYLIKLTDEAFRSNDVGHATTAITIDYSKAFDLVDHTILVKKLLEIGVRGKVIKLIISLPYLEVGLMILEIFRLYVVIVMLKKVYQITFKKKIPL